MRTQQPPPVQTPPRPLSPSEREESPSFNDEDDDLIEKWVKSMVEDGKRWNDIGIYEALAEVVRSITFPFPLTPFRVPSSELIILGL